jgi:hypothetical protein
VSGDLSAMSRTPSGERRNLLSMHLAECARGGVVPAHAVHAASPFKIRGRRVVEIDFVADTERLRHLELAVLDDDRANA